MKLILFLSLIILIFISPIYSISFTQCNQTVPTGIHSLANNINSSSGNCFEFLGDDTTIDCQGFTVLDNGTSISGFYNVRENITIKNCIIANFSSGVEFTSSSAINNILQNITTFNSLYGILLTSGTDYNVLNEIESYGNTFGIYFDPFTCDYNTINNSIIHDNSNTGIYVYDASYNIIDNTNVYNNNYGIYMRKMSYYNVIKNSRISPNYLYNIYFDYFSTQYPIDNTFYQNDLGDVTKIRADDWAFNTPNHFNFSGIGNYYSNYNYSACTTFNITTINSCTYKICTDNNQNINLTNGIIDYNPIISTTGVGCSWIADLEAQPMSQQSSSAFPYGGTTSILITILILTLGFLFS